MKEKLKTAICDLDLPILLFPVLVTCIVAIGFVFGCSCSIAMWWVAVALTIGVIWWRGKDRLGSLITTIMFALALGALWIGANVTCGHALIDEATYHYPAIRMLSAGWNPVWQSTPEKIYEAMNVSPDTYRSLHMISMPKAVWYFCAAFLQFSKAYFNLFFPVTAMLFVSLMYTIYVTFRVQGKLVAVGVCVAFYVFTPCWWYVSCYVDNAVAISAAGLLLTMVKCINTGHWDVPHLTAYSFWMCGAKQTSLLHCVVFWCVFCVTLLLLKRKVFCRHLFVSIPLLLVLFCVVNVSPYYTSFMNYGSPFYPRYSGDEKKWPTQNQTADFFIRNDDAAAMGHLGAYVNAFISHAAAKQYYVLTTGRKDFCPECRPWLGQKGTPTKFTFRILFCGSIMVLFLFCRTAGKFLAMSLVLGSIAMPTEMIGYVRYVPWATLGVPLCVGLLSAKRIQMALVAVLVTTLTPKKALLVACDFDYAYALTNAIHKYPPNTIICPTWQDPNIFVSSKQYQANLELLRSSIATFRMSKIVVDIKDVTKDIEHCQPFFDDSFYVPPDYDLCKYCESKRINKISDRKKRLLSYPKFIVKTFFVTLPKCIWEVVHG